MDIQEHFTKLERDSLGIWTATGDLEKSYPEDAHDRCFALEDKSFWFRHRSQCIVSLAKRFHDPQLGPFLDVGGGNGFITQVLESAGIDTILVEPGRNGAVNGRKRGIRHVVCADLQHCRIKRHSLSSIGLFDVIEHIEKDVEFLLDIHELLKPGGKIFLTVPSHQWLWSHQDVSAGHFRRYTRASLRELLSKTGFQVDFDSYFFWFLPLPIFLFRVLPSRFRFANKGPSRLNTDHHHESGAGFTRNLIGRLLEWEYERLSVARSVPAGASCILVASLSA